MKLVRCEKGHYYDADKFENCPHCNGAEDSLVTMPLKDDSVTIPQGNGNMRDVPVPSLEPEIVDLASFDDNDDDDEPKTVSLSQIKGGTDPVVGWLVGLNKGVYGKSYVLRTNKNFIGRSSSMDISIEGDATVSRDRHAVITYDPKSGIFIAQPGESRGLLYVNDEIVLNYVQLKKNDILLIGETKMMLIPCCDEAFKWEDWKDE